MKKRQKKPDKRMDELFIARGEMIEDNGEDWFVYSAKNEYKLICVLDGCGGIGSRKYTEYDDKTGAYIASHVGAQAIYEWFSNSDIKLSGNAIDGICGEIKLRLIEYLSEYERVSQTSVIKGSMAQSFPTTVSLILFTQNDDSVYTAFIWAGDSRGYVLTEYGLMQITKDDIDTGADAFVNLSDDGRLTNVVSAGGMFDLNSVIFKCDKPVILLTATDGCFGYFSTPMEFEYMLLNTLELSDGIEEWKENIENMLGRTAGDDYTMGAAILGYRNFRHLKRLFERRKKELYERYISVIESGKADRYELWQDYKNDYYRGA